MINIPLKLTVVVCLALIAVISAMTWTILRTNRLESAAQELALTVSEESFTIDYPATLIENLHPDYLAQIPPRSLLHYLNNATQRLGSLDSLISIRGSTDIPLLSIGDKATSANYEVELSFRNTPASLQLEMLLTNNQWLISKFDIVADVLAN